MEVRKEEMMQEVREEMHLEEMVQDLQEMHLKEMVEEVMME